MAEFEEDSDDELDLQDVFKGHNIKAYNAQTEEATWIRDQTRDSRSSCSKSYRTRTGAAQTAAHRCSE